MRKGIFLVLMVLLASLLVFFGCDGAGTDGDGDGDGNVLELEVGDHIGGDFYVTSIDDGGGFVAQKKDESGNAVLEGSKKIKKVTGEFYEDMTWSNDTVWYLEDMVFIGDDSAETVLTIEEGTTIKGVSTVTPGTLVIRRGSKIEAEGTATEPIVFTSALPAGSRSAGDWGGIVINGKASINVAGGTKQGEGNSGTFGGSDDTDSSGTLKYVRVEYAGRIFTSEDELNGIAFQGVGSGTTVDYIQVHQNKDDGVEFFGGTVDVKHVVLTGNQDDSMDWTDGWRGSAQYVIIQHYPGVGDQAIEADNLEGDVTATPRSAPTLANFTMIGNGSTEGAIFRRGTDIALYNSVLTNFDSAGGEALDETHDSGHANEASYMGVVVDSAAAIGDSSIDSSFTTDQTDTSVNVTNPTGTITYSTAGNAYVDNSTALAPTEDTAGENILMGTTNINATTTGATVQTGHGLETANYIGAYDGTNNWWSSWVTTAIE